MSLGLFFLAPDAAFRRAASPRLDARFQDEAAEVWRETRDWQVRLAPERPRHSAPVNLMMRYMEWSCALYRALQEHGVSQAEAGEFVESVGADIFRQVTAAMFKVSRLRGAKRNTRVRWLLGMMTRYFFASPFRHRHLPDEDGVSFDVTLCPFADYFNNQGLPELTRHAACNLDYCTARAFGVDLVRTQTIADGAEYCDFRWKFSASPRE